MREKVKAETYEACYEVAKKQITNKTERLESFMVIRDEFIEKYTEANAENEEEPDVEPASETQTPPEAELETVPAAEEVLADPEPEALNEPVGRWRRRTRPRESPRTSSRSRRPTCG